MAEGQVTEVGEIGLPLDYSRAIKSNRVERWQSGLTRTPGKREYLKSTGSSNLPLSATLCKHLTINIFDQNKVHGRLLA
jgi:hypothetical protein